MSPLAAAVAPATVTAPTAEGTRQTLRRATHALHADLDRHPMLHGLTRPAFPLPCYQLILTGYFHLYRSLEQGIEQSIQRLGPAVPFRYVGRRKLPWLAQDLQHFGIDPEGAPHRPLRAAAVATPSAPGQLIGILYAIEGATLGGQVISRALRLSLGLTATTGARFFNGYGDAAETVRRWRQFERYADSIRDDPAQLRLAAEAAAAIFRLIRIQLDDYHRRLAPAAEHG